MGAATFLTGRAGSGKSAWIRAAAKSSAAAGRRVFLIVPEQYTFEAERELAESFGSGLIGAGVYSFTSLARLIRRETGNRQVYLSKQGSRMVVRRVIADKRDGLSAFARVADTQGFAEKLVQLFAMFRGSGIEPDALRSAAERVKDSLLASKLAELSLLYGGVREYLAGRYMDENDMIDALIAGLPASSLRGADVFVDGFPKLNNQAFRVLETLMETAASLTVSFCADFSRDCRDRSVFLTDERALARLKEHAQNIGVSVDMVALPPAEDGAAEALRRLERELFAFRPRVYEGAADCVTVFAASDESAEAEAVAAAVGRAAREGIRYSDMAVIAASDALITPIARALERDGVPVFADIKKPLSGYPEAQLLRLAVSAAADGFRPRDVLAIAKTGLAGVSEDDAELFENYILRYGIFGSALERPFTFGEIPEGAERARQQLMEPLMELRAAMSRAGAGEKAEALFRYMERLGCAAAMAELANELRGRGELRLADEAAQVNNAIMELLDQLYVIMGDSQISNHRFLELLREGLEAGGVGVIPTTSDQVLLGSLSRTRARTVKALFLVGCNDGLLPAARQDAELIDDRELEELRKCELPVWGGVADELSADTLNIYTMFSKPTERLWLAWSLSSGGDTAQPSSLVDRTLEVLPNARRETDVGCGVAPFSVDAARSRLAGELRQLVDTGEAPEGASALYGYFARSAAQAEPLSQIERALFHTGAYEPLGAELAELLYGRRLSGSVSRLERFAFCPFAHFSNYGLKLQKRREYTEKPADEGGYYHALLESYISGVNADGVDWAELTFEDCRARLVPIMERLANEHNDGVLLSTARRRAQLRRMEDAALYTAWAATKQIQLGEFRPLAGEVRFGMGEGSMPPLKIALPDGRVFSVRGVIDRVDEARLSGQSWFRVIDYKRGGKGFDPSGVAAGLSIQLPIYVAALLAADRAARAAGMFYMAAKRPKGALGGEAADENVLNAVLKQFKLSGLTVNDVAVCEAMCCEYSNGSSVVISNLKQSGGGAAVTEAELHNVVKAALSSARRSFLGVANGEIAARPYRDARGRSACHVCDFRSVCGFDERFEKCAYRDIPAVTVDKLARGGASDDGDKMD